MISAFNAIASSDAMGQPELLAEGDPFELPRISLSPFTIVPLIFIAVGAYMAVGRFFYDAWVRQRTAYAFTKDRALILTRVFSESLVSLPITSSVSSPPASATVIVSPLMPE